MRSVSVPPQREDNRRIGGAHNSGRRLAIAIAAAVVAIIVIAGTLLAFQLGFIGSDTADRAIDVIPAAADTPMVFRHYGNPQIAVSLADTEVGGKSIDAVSHRIRFPRSGTLEAVRPFLIYVPGEEGDDSFYHKGDGGTVEFRLEADDGTPDHFPSGDVLARTGDLIGGPEIYEGSGPDDARVGGEDGDDGNFRRFSFLEPVDVEANTWYHLVMYNTGTSPEDNFVSYDDFFAGDEDRDPRVPVFEDADFSTVYQSDGAWTDRDSHWAIGEYLFSDGSSYGNGYMEVGSVNGPDRVANFVEPTQSIRQRFRPEEDLIVTEAHIGAMHVDGPNQVALRLTDADGEPLWDGTVGEFPTGEPSNTPTGSNTVGLAEFRGTTDLPSIELRSGEEYVLTIESVGGTHTIPGVRDGTQSYGFGAASTVTGHAEVSSSSGDWQGWSLGDEGPTEQFDLSFYFVTSNCVGCR